jgi:hypothetical protein
MFATIHNFTSAAQFIQAFKKGDLDLAKQIATGAPWAVNGKLPSG